MLSGGDGVTERDSSNLVYLSFAGPVLGVMDSTVVIESSLSDSILGTASIIPAIIIETFIEIITREINI